GEDENGRVQATLAQRPQHLEAVSMREHHVEYHAVERLVIHEEEAFLAGGGDPDVVVFGLEPVPESLGDLPFVLHHQDPHGRPDYIGSPLPARPARVSGTPQWPPPPAPPPRGPVPWSPRLPLRR